MLKKYMHSIPWAIFFWCAAGFIVLPMFRTVIMSIKDTNGIWNGFQNYSAYLSSDTNRSVILNTIKMGLWTVLLCGVTGTALAFYMSFVCIPLRKVIHMVLLSPMMVPGVIIVISFIQLYGESGILNKGIEIGLGLSEAPIHFTGLRGILFVHMYTQYVYFYINMIIALKYIDYATIEAARGFGASKVEIFRSIILPEMMPAFLTASLMTFVSGISSFSAPILIGGRYRVLSTQIMMSKANNYLNIASMQVVILMVIGLMVMRIVRYYESKYSEAMTIKSVPIERVVIKRTLFSVVLAGLMIVTMVMILLPVVAIVFLSFADSSAMMMEIFPKDFGLSNYIKLFTKRRVLEPFINSVTMSTVAVLIGLAITLPVAYLTTKKSIG